MIRFNLTSLPHSMMERGERKDVAGGSKSGLGKVRPAGQIRPAEALNSFSQQFPDIKIKWMLFFQKYGPKGPKNLLNMGRGRNFF